MSQWRRKLETLVNDRWLVFVCAIWIQSVAGFGYLFGGSMSLAIKTAQGYSQKQIALLGVAKNLCDAIGFLSGALSEVSPSWVVLLVGATQNLVGYGVVWLVVTGQLPNLPLWMLFVAIFVGTNGEIYYNTASLVSCIHNFPESRGPVVGILKGFSGLSGAILTQSLFDITQTIITTFGAILVIFMVVPILIPFSSIFISDDDVTLLRPEEGTSNVDHSEAKPLIERSDIPMENKEAPCIGEDFTLSQALRQANFWLIFMSLVLGVGSGITVIDNLGQICYSIGYNNTKVFVSLVSISNFLGRVAGGYFSELIIRKFALPRILAMSVVQATMSLGLIYYTIDWPGKIYVVTIVIGMGFGAHWAVAPASVSDLFGLKSFGSLYNFQIIALPIGSFVFSGVIASNIYDYNARKQAGTTIETAESLICTGSVCYSVTCGLMSMVCLMAMVSSLSVVYRTRNFYLRLHRVSKN